MGRNGDGEMKTRASGDQGIRKPKLRVKGIGESGD